tara:strand:- start:6624 stop:7370 length:747 start_codon:yes stop_codon:yes gene_type:complete
MDKVSVIMAAYNSEKTIKKSIESIINQTYSNFELIIIDDASTDNTLDIIYNFTNTNSAIKIIINQNNLGVAESRNKGIKMSNGKYIAFCDSDDTWLPSKLEKQINILSHKYDIVCSDYYQIDKNENIIKLINGPKIISYNKMLKSNLIPNSSAIYNTKIVGKFYQKKVGHEDYLMWITITKSLGTVYRIQEPLMNYRVHSNALTHNKFRSMLWTWNIFYNELNFSLLKSIRSIFIYSIIGIKKHISKI